MERVGYRNPFRRIPLAGSVLVAPRPIDWNADGRMDLLLADPSGNVRLFLQNEEGEPQLTWSSFLAYMNMDSCFALPYPVDWNGDGQLDLLVGNCLGQVLYFEGGAGGSFIQRAGSENPFAAISLGSNAIVYPCALDLDHDGDLDLVVNSIRSMQLSFFRRTADGGLIEVSGDANPFAKVWGRYPNGVDLDGDGFPEIMVNSDEGVSFYQQTVDEHTLVERSRYMYPFSSVQSRRVELVGLEATGAGKLHLFAISGGRLKMFRGSLDTAFEELLEHSMYLPRTTSAVFRVDWDKDGYPDLLVGEKGIRFFQGSPDGKQREVVGHSTFAGIQAGRGDAYPVAADWNHDGHLDLILGEGLGNIRYFVGTANGSLVERRGAQNPFGMIHVKRYSSFSVTDWDGDGQLDLIVGCWNGTLRFFKGTAGHLQELTGSDNPFVKISVGRRPDPFAVDLDDDGRPDLVVKNNAGRLYFYQRGSCKVHYGCGHEQQELKGFCQASGQCSCKNGYRGPDCTQCDDLYFSIRTETSLSSVCTACPGLLSSNVCNRRGRCLDDQMAMDNSSGLNGLGLGNVRLGECICNAPFSGADCGEGSCPAGQALKLDPQSPNSTTAYPLWEACLPCSPGLFKDLPGNARGCVKCPVGKYQDQSGSSECKLCPAGKYQTDVGSSVCTLCPAGKHSSPGSYSCSACFGCSWWHWPLATFGCCLMLVLISFATRGCLRYGRKRRASQVAGCLRAELHEMQKRGFTGEDVVSQLAPIWANAQNQDLGAVSQDILDALVVTLRSCRKDLSAIRRIKESAEKWAWHDAARAAQDLLLEARRESELRGIALEYILLNFENDAASKIVQREWREVNGFVCTLDSCIMRYKGTRDAPPAEWVCAPTASPPADPTFTQMAPVLAFGELSVGYGQLCPRDGEVHCSFVDGVHEQGSSFQANRFLSWVWGYNLSTACAALRTWCDDQRRVNPAFRAETVAIWWCFFCNNQFRFLQDQNRQTTADLSVVFGDRLKSVGRMLILMNDLLQPEYVKRIWCVFEVFVASTNDIPISVLLPEAAVGRHALVSIDQLKATCKVNAENATATFKDDEDGIKDLIRSEHGSFAYVNKVVERALLFEVVQMAR